MCHLQKWSKIEAPAYILEVATVFDKKEQLCLLFELYSQELVELFRDNFIIGKANPFPRTYKPRRCGKLGREGRQLVVATGRANRKRRICEGGYYSTIPGTRPDAQHHRHSAIVANSTCGISLAQTTIIEAAHQLNHTPTSINTQSTVHSRDDDCACFFLPCASIEYIAIARWFTQNFSLAQTFIMTTLTKNLALFP